MLRYPSYSIVRELVLSRAPWRRRAPGPEVLERSGGADRNRTDDIQLAKLALYQLSYSPNQAWVPEGGGPRWI